MGVWIETQTHYLSYSQTHVTPCMGVWIETDSNPENNSDSESHPVWVCGLKHRGRVVPY